MRNPLFVVLSTFCDADNPDYARVEGAAFDYEEAKRIMAGVAKESVYFQQADVITRERDYMISKDEWRDLLETPWHKIEINAVDVTLPNGWAM